MFKLLFLLLVYLFFLHFPYRPFFFGNCVVIQAYKIYIQMHVSASQFHKQRREAVLWGWDRKYEGQECRPTGREENPGSVCTASKRMNRSTLKIFVPLDFMWKPTRRISSSVRSSSAHAHFIPLEDIIHLYIQYILLLITILFYSLFISCFSGFSLLHLWGFAFCPSFCCCCCCSF